MENIELEVVGNVLTIKVDLNQQGYPSDSGKALIVASTHGWANGKDGLPEGISFSLNVCRKMPRR